MQRCVHSLLVSARWSLAELCLVVRCGKKFPQWRLVDPPRAAHQAACLPPVNNESTGIRPEAVSWPPFSSPCGVTRSINGALSSKSAISNADAPASLAASIFCTNGHVATSLGDKDGGITSVGW